MKTHKLIKQAISKELADFTYLYFLNKRKVALYFFESKYISPFAKEWGRWDDSQVPGTYSHYSDLVMETLLQEIKPLMEIETQTSLIETYSYARIYKKGDELKKHKDRPSCEVSISAMWGSCGTKWPIYMEDKPFEMEPGDAVVYLGCEIPHYRKPFTGNWHAQSFLHYVDQNGPHKDFKFDKRNAFDNPSINV